MLGSITRWFRKLWEKFYAFVSARKNKPYSTTEMWLYQWIPIGGVRQCIFVFSRMMVALMFGILIVGGSLAVVILAIAESIRETSRVVWDICSDQELYRSLTERFRQVGNNTWWKENC